MTAPEITSFSAVPDVHLPLTLTALEPISHSAGVSGNTQLLRTQDVMLPDGRRVAVPYVSGNSMRHTLRDALAWHLCRVLEVPEYSLPKRVVDLLWSGGALTSTGNQADLAMNRRVAGTLPGVSALGYSAKSDIVAGTLWVDNLHVVCVENAWRLPARLADHPNAALSAGAMRGEEFGTRHDVASTPAARYITTSRGESSELDLGEEVDFFHAVDTVQMIYDLQVIKAGSVLWGGLHLYAPTRGHVAALATAVDLAAPLIDGRRVINLGGKRATGYGACALNADLSVLGDLAEQRAAYEDHLRARRDEIITLLGEVVG